MWAMEGGTSIRFTSESAPKMLMLPLSYRLTRQRRWWFWTQLSLETIVKKHIICVLSQSHLYQGRKARVLESTWWDKQLQPACLSPLFRFLLCCLDLHLLTGTLAGRKGEGTAEGPNLLAIQTAEGSPSWRKWFRNHDGLAATVIHSTSIGELCAGLRIPKLISLFPFFFKKFFFHLPLWLHRAIPWQPRNMCFSPVAWVLLPWKRKQDRGDSGHKGTAEGTHWCVCVRVSLCVYVCILTHLSCQCQYPQKTWNGQGENLDLGEKFEYATSNTFVYQQAEWGPKGDETALSHAPVKLYLVSGWRNHYTSNLKF